MTEEEQFSSGSQQDEDCVEPCEYVSCDENINASSDDPDFDADDIPEESQTDIIS